jgi:polysaccharide biosynthesis/export protein
MHTGILTLRSLWCLLLAGLLLGACGSVLAEDKAADGKDAKPASPAKDPKDAKPSPSEEYRLRPGDEIAISVSPQKEFDCAGVLLPDGMLYLRNVGGVKASGMTVEELKQHVLKKLDEELVDPVITVSITKLAPPPAEKPVKGIKITVVGAVGKPGPLEIEDGVRLRKALDLAGGTAKDADLESIIVLHKNLTRTLLDLSTDERVSDPAHNAVLQEGDSIEVRLKPTKTTPYVRIAGLIGAPNQYELKQGMTLEDLIMASGKLSPLADVEKVELRRKGEPAARTVNLVAQRKLGLNGQIRLQPDDEVFIPEMKNVVMLLGVVPQPGPYGLKPGQKIRDFFLEPDSKALIALDMSKVDLQAVELIRNGEKHSKTLNLKEVTRHEKHKDNIVLHSGDMLLLPGKKAAKGGIMNYLSSVPYFSILFGLF